MIKYFWFVLLFCQIGYGDSVASYKNYQQNDSKYSLFAKRLLISKKYNFDNSTLPHLIVTKSDVKGKNHSAVSNVEIPNNKYVASSEIALNESKYLYVSSPPLKFRNYQIFEGRDVIISEEGKNHLRKWAERFKLQKYKSVTINAYTDNVPPKLLKARFSTNFLLSEARAKLIADYLIIQGVNANQIQAHGLGDTNPIAPNDSEENRSKNRRIEFLIIS
jgi:outer membrane protein OmpA-like peptidoglycan-associated protein